MACPPDLLAAEHVDLRYWLVPIDRRRLGSRGSRRNGAISEQGVAWPPSGPPSPTRRLAGAIWFRGSCPPTLWVHPPGGETCR